MKAWHEALFTPRRVALVGASDKPGKLGHLFMQNLLAADAGFAGEVIAVHPSAAEILGRPAYARVQDIPGGVDLAVVVAPPDATPAVIEDCAIARVPVGILISGGFAEAGAAGIQLQEKVAALARAGGVRLIGPNCFGVINVGAGLNASLGLGMPAGGGISLFTQSGAYGMAAFSRSQDDGIGFAKVIAPGNKIDLDEVEILRFLGDDPDTRVVAMLLESIGDGRALVEVAQAVAAKKPVVILKTGRGTAAQRAAASHTAALAGDYSVTKAALLQVGVRVVTDGLSLLDTAAALDRQPVLKGRRIAVITNSGGTGVELADLLEEEGLLVPALSQDLQKQIQVLLPAYGSARNPVDVTTDWPRFPEMYGGSLRLLLRSDEIDAVVLVLLQRSALMPELTDRVLAEIEAARLEGCAKPVHVCWVAPKDAEGNRRKLIAAGIPCHPWALRTARALAACRSMDWRPMPDRIGVFASVKPAAATGWLPTDEVFQLLSQAGLPVSPWHLAPTADAAMAAAEKFGFPVVAKAQRGGLVHKTDVGAVRLGLSGASSVAEAFRDFAARLGAGPALVQPQAKFDLELFIGGLRDAQFGPVVMFGLGGVLVEILRDVTMRLAPFTAADALSMIDEVRGHKLLDGYRGKEKIDRAALSKLLERVSHWFAGAEWIGEFDLNPLVASGSGFLILDGRIRAAG